MLFIRVIENKCPSPVPGWTAGHRVNSSLHAPREQVEEGKLSNVEGEIRPVLATLTFTSACPSLKDTNRYLHFADLTQDLLDFTPSFGAQFLARRTPLSASSLYFVRPPLAPIVLFIPVPGPKHDCRIAFDPPTPRLTRLPFLRGCYEHVVGLGEHTHRHTCTCAAKRCVRCVNWLFWDCDPDLTLLCLNFLHEPGSSAVGFRIVHTLDLLLI